MRKIHPLTSAVLVCLVSSPAWADYRDDIGYTALQAELGAALPTGAGVRVAQIEARTDGGTGGSPVYMADPGLGQFSGKTINNLSGNPVGTYSGHAITVGQLFYGTGTALAAGITTIDAYEANDWLGTGYLQTGVALLPAASSARVANHSWIGSGTAAENEEILVRTEWLANRDEFIQVAAMGNGGTNLALLGSGYNVIAVGRTDGSHGQGSVAISGSALYGAGRTRPDLVAPQGVTSRAAPIVSAAAALLVETGHSGGASLSHGSTTNRNGDTLYNAERSETVKAVLMAGADRFTTNGSTTANITDYRAAGHQSSNGLDNRYGAGQVNIDASYHILAAGEQDSQQDGGGGVGLRGFDYDPAFGGSGGSNATASYFFNTNGLTGGEFSASLVWNLAIADNFSSAALRHMNLSLFDATTDPLNPVATSASLLDNTQNLWLNLFGDHQYELRVTAADGGAFNWDYALAWNVAPVPVPGAVWLFGSALAGLLGWGRRNGRV